MRGALDLSRPSGTNPILNRAPNAEALGYCRVPLWDSRAQACALVGAAIHGVAILQPRDGMPQPGDTASVTAASVTEIAQLKFSGDTVDSWWVVTLRVPSRPYDIDVRINKRDSSVESRRVHKPVADR